MKNDTNILYLELEVHFLVLMNTKQGADSQQKTVRALFCVGAFFNICYGVERHF